MTNSKKQFRIIVKKVGQLAEVKDTELDLEIMQGLVGGYIERWRLLQSNGRTINLWFNEDGRRLELPTQEVDGILVYGNCFIEAEEDCTHSDLTDEEVRKYLGILNTTYQDLHSE